MSRTAVSTAEFRRKLIIKNWPEAELEGRGGGGFPVDSETKRVRKCPEPKTQRKHGDRKTTETIKQQSEML